MESKEKKKGILATIWESMTKTGGCCGSGESCCGPSEETKQESNTQKEATQRDECDDKRRKE